MRNEKAMGIIAFLVTLTLAFTVLAMLFYCYLICRKAAEHIGSKYTNDLENVDDNMIVIHDGFYEGSSINNKLVMEVPNEAYATIGRWHFVSSVCLDGPWTPVFSERMDKESAQILCHTMLTNYMQFPDKPDSMFFNAYMEK